MAEITDTTEPRPSLLFAAFFTGIALATTAAKGHGGPMMGEIGKWLTIGSCAWLLARAWYLRRGIDRVKE